MNLGFLCSWEFSVVTNLFNGIPCHPVAGRQFPATALENAAYNLSKAFTFLPFRTVLPSTLQNYCLICPELKHFPCQSGCQISV